MFLYLGTFHGCWRENDRTAYMGQLLNHYLNEVGYLAEQCLIYFQIGIPVLVYFEYTTDTQLTRYVVTYLKTLIG